MQTYGKRPRAKRKDSVEGPSKRRKVSEDLSAIFASSPSVTPTKLARRMLGRSKTESSIESHSPSARNDSGMDRTSSLPNIPDRSSSPASSTFVSFSPNSPSKTSTTRTYAGKYRSFLMTLPESSSGPAEGLTTKDDFESRESYSSLRSRWGVDNSEDDPRPSFNIASPTNSTTTTSEGSPSRTGNRKGKVFVRTAQVPNGMMNPLKSISELRNKGESRRFLDEVGYLFEGLDPKCGVALRRSSTLEITTKLCDPEFRRKAKAADFFARTWELLLLAGAGKGGDKILDILLAFFLALVARDPVSLAELAERPLSPSISASDFQGQHELSLVDILARILENVASGGDLLSDQNSHRDEFYLRTPKLPKKDRAIISSIHKVITSKSFLFSPSTSITTSLLVTSTLQALPPSVLSTSCLPSVLISLRHCLSPTTKLYTSLSSSEASSSLWLDIVEGLSYECIHHQLKLMDGYLLGQWTSIEEDEVQMCLDKARDEWMIRDLVALGVCCEVKSMVDKQDGQNEAGADHLYRNCFTLTLRTLISLTHDDKGWAAGVLECQMTMGLILRTVWKAGNEVVRIAREDEEEEAVNRKAEESDDDTERQKMEEAKEATGGSHAFDILCLVLGLLTNLVQVVDDAKSVMQESRLNPTCTFRNQVCLKRCTCSQKEARQRTGIEVLVWLYEQLQWEGQAGSRRDSHHHHRRRKEDGKDENRSREREQEQEAQSSFLSGHLAVLFGLLMMGPSGSENREAILGFNGVARSPPSRLTKQERMGRVKQERRQVVDEEDEDGTTSMSRPMLRLDKLTNQAREFGAFYSVVSRRMTMSHGYGHWDSFLRSSITDGGTLGTEGGEGGCGGAGGSGVVEFVVEFLEGLS